MSHVGEKSFEQGSTFQSIWTKMSVPRSMWATELMRFHASTRNTLRLFCNWISLVFFWSSWPTSAKRLLTPLKDVPWTVASKQGSFQSLSSTLWSILWPHSHFWLSLKYSEWVLSLTPSVYLTHILLCQLKVENQSWATYCFSFS